jgi:hypothetical protein
VRAIPPPGQSDPSPPGKAIRAPRAKPSEPAGQSQARPRPDRAGGALPPHLRPPRGSGGPPRSAGHSMRAAYGPSGPPPDRSSPVSAWPGSSPLVTETTSSALFAGHATVITLRTPTMPHRGDYVNTPGQDHKTARGNFRQLSSSDPSCLTEPPTPQAFRSPRIRPSAVALGGVAPQESGHRRPPWRGPPGRDPAPDGCHGRPTEATHAARAPGCQLLPVWLGGRGGAGPRVPGRREPRQGKEMVA